MRLLVTGGAGYIGSVVTAQLLQAGHEVLVVDDLSTGFADAVPDGAALVEASLHDAWALRTALHGAEGVLHFAAKSLVGESVRHPERYWDANVLGTFTLLETMRDVGVSRIVFSSTAATYGEPAQVPIEETAPTAPTNPYGASKLAIDHMLRSYATAHGLAAASLRYFNVAGASGRFGERHPTETHLIPLVLEVLLGVRPHVQVFGTDYPTTDGTAVRDYIHVEDLARAHLLALDALEPGEHKVWNLGNGAGYSVRQVIAAAEKVTGRSVTALDAPRRAGDPAVLVASSQRIAADLGWVPAKPSLEAMIGDAWEWARSYR